MPKVDNTKPKADNTKPKADNTKPKAAQPTNDKQSDVIKQADTSGIDNILADEGGKAGFVSELDKLKNKDKTSFNNQPTQPLKPDESQELEEYDEFAQKHPRLAKIRDFFRRFRKNVGAGIKNPLSDENETVNSETRVNINENTQPTQQPATTIDENTQPEKTARDKFVEELRQMVDEEYKRQVRGEKEAEYLEAHKIKTDSEETKDIDER